MAESHPQGFWMSSRSKEEAPKSAYLVSPQVVLMKTLCFI